MEHDCHILCNFTYHIILSQMKSGILFSLLIAMAIFTANAQSKSLKTFLQPDWYQGSSVQYGNNPSAGHYVQADDAKIYYETYGEGSPIVMLHGGGVGCTYEWGEMIDSLSKTNTIIAVSTRGHGKSEIGTEPISYEQRAKDVYAVIQDAIPGQTTTIMGFSDGGYTAYKVASLYPEIINKIITIGAGEIKPETRKFQLATVDYMKKIDPDFMETQTAIMPEPGRLQEYWNEFYAFYNNLTVSKELFMSLQCPVLVMAGEVDPNAPLTTIIAAYQMIPNSQLAIIANAGHGCFIDNFAAVWANIVPFLNQ